MQITIKSRALGPQTFFMEDTQDAASCVYLGRQICEGGEFLGPALTCDGTIADLRKVARRWLRQRRKLLERG